MLIKGNYSTLDEAEHCSKRVFCYELLRKELGEFPRYRQYDGEFCEEVTIDEEGIREVAWQIEGTSKLLEKQWTKIPQLCLF